MADVDVQRHLVLGGPVPLRRPAGAPATRALHRDLQVPAGGELVEVVAGHVGVELEALGDLGRGDAIGPLVDVEEDVPAGRVPERRGDRGDRRSELGGGQGFCLPHRYSTYTRVGEIPEERAEETWHPATTRSWKPCGPSRSRCWSSDLVELGLVDATEVRRGGHVKVSISEPAEDYPYRDHLREAIEASVGAVPGVKHVEVETSVLDDEGQERVRRQLIGDPEATAGSQASHGHAEGRAIPFAEPGAKTRVLLIASGKGGVGKSSVTANLAIALAQRGKKVGIVDADVWGFSIPRMLGVDPPAGPRRPHAHPARGQRRAGHLHGLLRRGGHAGHLAGPDAAQGARAVPDRRVVGRSRLPAGRPAPGHRRHLDLAGPVPAPVRGLRRHHAAAGGPEGVAQRAGLHGREGPPRGPRASSRT